MAFLRPEYFANGEAIQIDNDLLEQLRYGYPPLGWEGDPNMNLWYVNQEDRVYLTSVDDNGDEYVICRSPVGTRVVDLNLIHKIVTHDRNRGYDLGKAMDENDARVVAEREKLHKEQLEEVGKKLHWGLKKDLG